MILEALIIIAMASPRPEIEKDVPKPPVAIQAGPREKILAVAKSAIGWREKTGRNDGPQIEKILASVDLEGTGSPWCAAFVVWVYDEAGFPGKVPRSAWSPSIVANPTWKRGRGETPRPADVYGLFFQSKGRVAHAGIIEKWSGGVCVGIEGNTSPQSEPGSENDREGQGVCRRWRPTASIYCSKNYL